MKLLNKLLPVATVASVACVVTPLVTSCGYKTFKYDLTDMDDYEYVEQKEGKLSTAEGVATKEYLKDVKENKKILADDIAYFFANGFINGEKEKLSVGVGKVEETRITFKFKYENEGSEDKGSISIEYKNIPANITYDSDLQLWFLGSKLTNPDLLKADEDWKLVVKLTGDDISDEMKEGTFDHNSDTEDLKYASVYFGLLSMCSSHYLANVTPEK